MLSFVCLVALFVFRDQPRLAAVQRGAVDAVGSVASFVLAPLEAWGSLSSALQSRAALRDEILQLRQENLVLKGQAQRLSSALAEVARYRTLLNSVRDVEAEPVVARITALSPDAARHSIILDKGASDGLREGQPVLSAEGLMGQLIWVGDRSSAAILITDGAHALPVQVNRSGLRAIAEGTGEINRLVIKHLPATTDIRVGDLLVSSGLGGRFPHGYPVGRVTDVTASPGDAFSLVHASPTAALDRGRYVLVVVRDPEDLSEVDS